MADNLTTTAGTRSVDFLAEDHQRLETTITELDALLTAGTFDPAHFTATYAALTEELARHFEREEAWMRRIRYRGLRDHARQHRLLEETLATFAPGKGRTFGRVEAGRVQAFVAEWLVHHMDKADLPAATTARVRASTARP